MNDPLLPSHDASPESGVPKAVPDKAVRGRGFWKSSTRFLTIGLAGLAVAGSLVWLWRTDLAEAGLEAFLKARGIEGGAKLREVSPHKVVLEGLRLGPTDKPTLVLPKATISFHYDIKLGKLVIDELVAEGGTLQIRRGRDGQLDFGSLQPFLEPSEKPSPLLLRQVLLKTVQVQFESPAGPGRARLRAWGGDQQGWRIQGLVDLPRSLIGAGPSSPVALGLFIETGSSPPGTRPQTTRMGVAIRPAGQNVNLGTSRLDRVSGDGRALVTLDRSGLTQINLTHLDLSADQVRAPTFVARKVQVRAAPARWQHMHGDGQIWSRTGFGTLIGQVLVGDLVLNGTKVRQAEVDFSGARTANGLTRIDLKATANQIQLANQARAGRTQLTGFAQTRLGDLAAVNSARWQGEAALSAQGLVLGLTPGLGVSGNIRSLARDSASGVIDINYVYDGNMLAAALKPGTKLSLSSGLSLAVTPDSQKPLVGEIQLGQADFGLTRLSGAADLRFSSPGGGRGQARLAELSWTPDTWSLAAQAVNLQGLALPGPWRGLRVSGDVGQLALRGKAGGVPSGSGRGSLTISAAAGAGGLGLGAGQINLTGNVQGDGKRITARLSGPVDGFGHQGSGVRQGRIDINVEGRARSNKLVFDLDGAVTARGFTGLDLSATDLAGRFAGQVIWHQGANSTKQRANHAVREAGWDSTVNITASLSRLTSGDLELDGLKLSAPIRASGIGRSWQADLDLTAETKRLTHADTVIDQLRLAGPINARPDPIDQPIQFLSASCLQASAEAGHFPGDAWVGAVKANLCPDPAGRLASLSDTGPILYADAQFDPLELRLGATEDGRSLRLGAVRGNFKPANQGGWQLDLTSQEVGYSFKLPDGGFAEIYAMDSLVRMTPGPNGMDLRGKLAGLRAKGLPVQISGTATADLQARRTGLVGNLAFENLLLRDAPTYFPTPDEAGNLIERPARFAMLSLTGDGSINGSQIDIQSEINLADSGAFLARAILNHNSATGLGRIDALAERISFGQFPTNAAGVVQNTTRPLDADDIVPALQGVILDMVGNVSGSASMAWGPNQQTVSDARLSTANLDFATMLGEVTNLTGDFSLEDLLKVRSAGLQGFTVASFDPGLPIQDIQVQFALPGDNTLELRDASWPFAEGRLSVRPATWTFRDGDQAFAIDVEQVDLAKFLGLSKVPNLQIDGKVSGVFPVEVRNGIVEIVGGRLEPQAGGGKIRYTRAQPLDTSPQTGRKAPWYQRLFTPRAKIRQNKANPSPVNQIPNVLEYEIDVITVDGRLTGDLTLGVVLVGSNSQVLSGIPVKLNAKATLPIGQINDMVSRLLETATTADMLKELDQFDRDNQGPGFLSIPSPKP